MIAYQGFAWLAVALVSSHYGLLAQDNKTIGELGIKNAAQQDDNAVVVVPLLHDYDEAIEKAEKLDRPILVVLGAEWCGPCKQLEKELQQPIAEPIFQRWVVVKVDIDEEVALAKEWQVGAIPAFRILGVDQEVSASNEGFGGLKKLQAWLAENFDSANPKTQRLLRDDKPIDSTVIVELIAMLHDRRPANRKLIADRLAKNKNLSARPLVELLSQGNLSQKIAALEILEKWSAPISGMDPWEPDSISAERLAILGDWLRN
jgi:thioredoxin-like negative regulator of GroEL